MQQCTIKIRLYAEAGDTTRETRGHDLGYGRREGSRRQVPGLAAKTGGRRAATYKEENGRPHPERDFLVFRLVPQRRKGGDEESRSHLARRRACAESDSRPTFFCVPRTDIRTTPAPRARRTPSPGIAISGGFWILIDRAFTATVRNYYLLVADATTAVDVPGKTWQLLSNAWCYFCFLCSLLSAVSYITGGTSF